MSRFLKRVLLYALLIVLLGCSLIYISVTIAPGKMLGNSTEYALWDYKKKIINSRFPHSRNVIIGDSRSMTGFNPVLIGHNFINLSLSGTTAFEGYVTLKQYLRHHQADTVIVSYGIFHYIESDVLEKWTLPYTLPAIADLDALENAERQHHITINNQEPEYWLYLKRKATYYHFPILLRPTFIENLRQNDYNATVMRQMEQTYGFSNVSTVDSCNATDTEVEIQQKSKRFVVNPVITGYIDSIYALSVKRRIKVIFLIPPINKASYTALKGTLFFKQYVVFREELKRRYPVMTIDNKYVYLPNNYFHDGGHLNQRGVKFFSKYIRDELQRW
jgi:hypothetical protein